MVTTGTTYRLYAEPNFLRGIARCFDLFGVITKYNRSETPQEADVRALQSDWAYVGLDLIEASKALRDENDEEE